MERYHQRRPEKAISDEQELLDIIDGQAIMTLAMSKDNEPYLVTVNYGYDVASHCFYFHCAQKGKKLDYLRSNPVVWGQVLDDRGYLDGECNHAFASVHFRGRVTFIDDETEKRRALDLMIDHLESEPAVVKEKQLTPERIERTIVGRIDVDVMTGKKGPAK